MLHRWTLIWIFLFYSRLLSSLNSSDDFDEFHRTNNQQDSIIVDEISFAKAETKPPTSESCSTLTINIDSTNNKTNPNFDTFPFTSSLKFISPGKGSTNDAVSTSTETTKISQVEIIFNIPYSVSNESIRNQTIFIVDAAENKILKIIDKPCWINSSSIIVKYSTSKPLFHQICFFLAFNSTIMREIIFCRTIQNPNNNSTINGDQLHGDSHAVGPSGFFILSQSIIILIMMLFIFAVQTAREKNLAQRGRERLTKTRIYQRIRRIRQQSDTNANAPDSATSHSASALQAGLNFSAYPRVPQAHGIHLSAPSTDQHELTENNLPNGTTDRTLSKLPSNRDLLNVKELTRRISNPIEINIEPDPANK